MKLQASKKTQFQTVLDAGVALSIGVFPAFHITSIQLAAILILIGAALNYKNVLNIRFAFKWQHFAILQFLVLSLVNILLYPSLEGNRGHYTPLALEALVASLVLVFVLMVYVQDRPSLQSTLKHWLPVGLCVSFCVLSAFYFQAGEGARVRAFTPSSLIPPLWFLTLTLICFNDFKSMSARRKLVPYGLLIMATFVVIYCGGRLAMLTWLITACALIFFYVPNMGAHGRRRSLGIALFGLCLLISLAFTVDALNSGTMWFRLRHTIEAILSGDARNSFLRLEIWSAAWTLISERPLLGHGQINERFLLHQLLDQEWWFRAHQTYLSYWIGGGLLGLASGLFFQMSAFALILHRSSRDLRPAVIGLVIVVGLNGLTESIFQSFVSVQFFVLLVLLLSSGLNLRQKHTGAILRGQN